METEYRIGGGTKFLMLATALVLDFVQFVTPGFTDHMITAFALMIFAEWFFKKGALTASGGRAVMYLKWVIPFSEFIFPHLPGIFLMVWAQITISRAADKVLPDWAHTAWGIKRLRGDAKDIRKYRKEYKHQKKQVGKYARGKLKRSTRSQRRAMRAKAKVANRGSNIRAERVNVKAQRMNLRPQQESLSQRIQQTNQNMRPKK